MTRHVNRGRVGRGMALGGLAASVALLAGCGEGLLSADHAAGDLQQFLAPNYGVHCAGTGDVYWTYDCTVTPPGGSKDQPYVVRVRVDDYGIIDRKFPTKR
jgi:hypothetical protein